jgi:hypothetical protein
MLPTPLLQKQRLCALGVTALFLLSTGLFYFQWTGPEVFTAALVLAAAMGFVERRYVQAALLSAAASLQNPSAVFLLPFISSALMLELLSKLREARPTRRVAGQILGLLVAGLVVALPYAWSYWKFGVFNPIVATGVIDYSLISISRFIALFFDLNQGMIVGLPWLILAGAAALFARLMDWITLRQIVFRPEDWLLMAVVLMSIPILAQDNWNNDHNVFMRYAAWIAMPGVVWVAVTLDQVSVSWRQLIMIPAIGAQIAMVLVVSGIVAEGRVAEGSFLSFQPWVPVLWATIPRIYNPVPELFFERTVGHEGAIHTPVFYPPNSSRFLKILTKSDGLDGVCGEQGQLRPGSSKWGNGPYVSAAEKGYFYISGHLQCAYSLPFEASFTSADKVRLEMRGWSTPESHGTWNASGSGSVSIPLDTVPAAGVRVRISGTAFVHERLPTQLIQINAEGQEIDSWTARFPQYDIAREFIVKRDKIGEDGYLTLQFMFPNATSPAQLGMSGDTRQLSMELHSIRVDPIFAYSLPFEASFTSADKVRLEMRGWSTPESHGTWNASGSAASVSIPLDTVPAAGVRVRISGTAFVHERLPTQLIQINAGGQEIDSWTTRFPQYDIAREFIVKRDKIGQDGYLTLQFRFPNATSPAQLGLSGDTRQLSMALHSIRVDPM